MTLNAEFLRKLSITDGHLVVVENAPSGFSRELSRLLDPQGEAPGR